MQHPIHYDVKDVLVRILATEKKVRYDWKDDFDIELQQYYLGILESARAVLGVIAEGK